MARRNDHSREELRKMAIEAGQKIISAEGFSNFSARKVAKDIGYTVGTLYNIFESHDDLILHINATTLDKLKNYIDQNAVNHTDAIEEIRHLAKCYLNFTKENYPLWSVLFEFNLPQGTVLPEWYSLKIRALFAYVEKSLLRIFIDDTQAASRAAKVLWAGIHGICELGMTGKLDTVEAESVQILMDSLIENYMRGLNMVEPTSATHAKAKN